MQMAAYRVVQGALTNVARHAGVTEASVRLWADPEVLRVQVEDRGKGFDAEAVLARKTSTGLFSMRERALMLGGQFAIESAPGGGTSLTLELPLGSPAPEHEPEPAVPIP